MGLTIEEHTCDTCEYGEWYRRGYDITMMDDECGGCCSWNDKWQPMEVEDGNDYGKGEKNERGTQETT